MRDRRAHTQRGTGSSLGAALRCRDKHAHRSRPPIAAAAPSGSFLASSADVAEIVDGAADVAARLDRIGEIQPGRKVHGVGYCLGGTLLSIAAAAITGRKSRANPAKTAVSSGLGSIATDLAGPLAGRFVRNIIGGLMR